MFKSLYDSPLVATLLPCIASLVVVVWAQTKKPFVRAYGTAFAIAIAADAFLNGPWTFVKANTPWATAVGVFFVILGDFRYFVVLEESLHNTRKLLRGLSWAFVVPVSAQIVRWIIPRIEKDERSTFLLYEILFFVLAIFIRSVRVPKAKDARLASRATTFELLQYGTWIVADVGLVFGAESFYLPRLVANLMYYVAFVPTMMKLLESAMKKIFFAFALALAFACKKPEAADDGATLTFVRDGKTVKTMTRAELVRAVPPETVEGFDPYYGKKKRFRAVRLSRVLEQGFGVGNAFDKEEFVLRARDGYAVPMHGALVTEDGAFVAIEDLEVAGWEPIGPQHANPAPFYLVWSKAEQTNLDSHPRPWQLDKIEIARFDAIYPHTSPGAPDGSPAAKGYVLFRDHCLKCHTINREGGHVGPDLNVPQNITEYRPEDQIRAYIKNPATFRYGNMPAHPDLRDDDLDALIAYLRAMKDKKHDEK